MAKKAANRTTVADPAPRPGRQEGEPWEYQLVWCPRPLFAVTANKLSQDGWELIGTHPRRNQGTDGGWTDGFDLIWRKRSTVPTQGKEAGDGTATVSRPEQS